MAMSVELKPVRRIVTIDDEAGKSVAIADGPSPDVRSDPARPGYSSVRIWVADSSPVSIGEYRDSVLQQHTVEPPRGGSVCRIVTFSPDETFLGKVGAKEIEAFFRSMGSPSASTYSPKALHPYMQKTQTLDFCLVLEGEITLVLDTAEVQLKAGDTIVQRGTNHAWSNRSNRPCRIAFSSHDARP
jgi:mannose-6-phosphate isomerase-like protein (cupin superfamily)